MIGMLRRRWDDFWFRPGSSASFIALRVIVAAHSLWILTARPDLPAVVAWPVAFWRPIPASLFLRFGYFGFHPEVEWILFGLLMLVLIAVLFGFAIRVTAFAAGLLLYHFAPLDSLLASGDFISMSGLTVPTVAMFGIWAADEYRWPVVLSRLLLALSFFLSGITKLTYVGLSWYGASNIRQAALTAWSLSGRPVAFWIATHTWAAWAIGIGSASLDALFLVAVFSRRVRWIVIPLALVALVVRSLAFGVHWLAAPLLLLFVDWDWLVGRYSGWKNPAMAQRACSPAAGSTFAMR
jgi:hypothetical protein